VNKAIDHMSPDASPGEVSATSGVRRVNNVPLYIVGGIMGVFLLAMAMVALDRAQQQNRPVAAMESKASDTAVFAREITGERKDGIVPAAAVSSRPVADPVSPPSGFAVPIARPANLDLPPMPPRSQGQTTPIAPNESEDRIRVAKLQQLDEAIRAKTALPIASVRGPGSSSTASHAGAAATREDTQARLAAVRQQLDAATPDDPAAAYMARLQQIQMGGVGDPTQRSQPPAGSSRNDIAQFAGSGQGDRWLLQARPEAPRSPYELRAGFVVPATLISGINSALPGQIVAQVSQDVFDTPTGNFRLIPQGSRLVGAYSSEVAYGQARILVAWQRIVFPDGKAMDIGSMPGADSAGFAGFKDQVNNHYLRLFSSAFLMSGVTAGIALSQPNTVNNNNTRPTASSAISEALGQQLGQVTAQLISKNLNIAPTLEIRPGYRFNVIVTKDMTFSEPYRAFDY
jgi:type IV secretory pathway VirB10-like protein